MAMTLREVEKLTGYTRFALQKRIERGDLIASKQGKKYVVEESEVAKLKPRDTGKQAVMEKEEVPTKGSNFTQDPPQEPLCEMEITRFKGTPKQIIEMKKGMENHAA